MTSLNVQTKKNEKGVALIFSLIILSLLMIMALAFALDSMFEQKAAYNSANASAARILAKSQLKQVLSLITAGETNFENGNIYSKDITYGTGSPIEHFDMLREQDTPVIPYSRLRVTGVLDENNDNSCLRGTSPAVNWNYIRNSDGNIIGRTAFVIVPDAKIPLDSLIDISFDEKDDNEARIGGKVSEINVRGALPIIANNHAGADIITISGDFNWLFSEGGPAAGGGKRPLVGWESFDELITAIESIPNAVALSLTEESELKSNLTLSSSSDKEAFWADKNGNDKIDDMELYRRFNLARTDWDPALPADNNNANDLVFLRTEILLDTGNTGTPTQEMQEWLDADTNATITSGLSWLACFGYQADGTVDISQGGTFGNSAAGVIARRNQIAANLKDYCDDDDNGGSILHRPTSDVSPTRADSPNWLDDATQPTFTGNERTPYINKIGVQATSTLSSTAVAGGKITTMTVSVKPYIGLIDMYRNIYPNNVYATVEGTVSVSVSLNGGAYTALPNIVIDNSSLTISGGASNWAVDSNGYSTWVGGTASADESIDSGVFLSTVTATVKVTNITITKVVLHDVSGNGYDYVKTLTVTPPTPNDIAFTTSSTEQTKYYWAGLEVNDPRQNLNVGDWVKLTPQENTLASSVFAVTGANECQANSGNPNTFIGSPGIVSPSTVDPSYDVEGSDPASGQISTAFIRNAPMESPWELGFIHRGEIWQTINLKKYVPVKGISVCTIGANQYIAGGGAYDDGDANILDQIKMTAEPESPQKINLRAIEDIFFDTLFSKIKLGADIARDADTSVPVVPANHMTTASIAGLTPVTGIEIAVSPLSLPPGPSAAYSTMRQAIKDWFETADLENYTNLSRASVVGNVSSIFISADSTEPNPTISLLATNTDAAQEELIGKIINLTKFGREAGNFTIIVVAQTIKDVGVLSTATPNEISIWKTPADDSAALEVQCQLGRFDVEPANPATDTWTDDAYGDDITSEQKILVTGSYISGQLEIKSFQYID